MNYDPQAVEKFYDELGHGEWERFVRSPVEEIKLHVHTHYLRTFVPPHSCVLEIGAGPGRFTEVLHGLGCQIVVADLSTVQLGLNRQFAHERGFAVSVEQWLKLDICDLSALAAETFDVVVAYGGPLSYVFEKRDQALQECRRVLKPSGLVIASVMSLWGTVHRFLGGILEFPAANTQAIIRTGDLTPENEPGSKHHSHLFRAQEFQELFARNEFRVVAVSASNTISMNHEEVLGGVRQDPVRWASILAYELEASAEQGYLDGGPTSSPWRTGPDGMIGGNRACIHASPIRLPFI